MCPALYTSSTVCGKHSSDICAKYEGVAKCQSGPHPRRNRQNIMGRIPQKGTGNEELRLQQEYSCGPHNKGTLMDCMPGSDGVQSTGINAAGTQREQAWPAAGDTWRKEMAPA